MPFSSTTESYAASARNLGAGALAAWWTAARLEASPLAGAVARAVSGGGMGASNLWLYGAAPLYLALVGWHLCLRSAASKALARRAADAPGALVGCVLVCWNLALSFLSMVMLAGMGRGAAAVFAAHGWRSLVCDGSEQFLVRQPLSAWLVVFCLSKFPELLDTLLLVLRGRDVRFLHWCVHSLLVLSD